MSRQTHSEWQFHYTFLTEFPLSCLSVHRYTSFLWGPFSLSFTSSELPHKSYKVFLVSSIVPTMCLVSFIHSILSLHPPLVRNYYVARLRWSLKTCLLKYWIEQKFPRETDLHFFSKDLRSSPTPHVPVPSWSTISSVLYSHRNWFTHVRYHLGWFTHSPSHLYDKRLVHLVQ